MRTGDSGWCWKECRGWCGEAPGGLLELLLEVADVAGEFEVGLADHAAVGVADPAGAFPVGDASEWVGEFLGVGEGL